MWKKQIGLSSCHFACQFYRDLYCPFIYFHAETMGDTDTYILLTATCELTNKKIVSPRPIPDMFEKGVIIKHIIREY